MGTKNDKGGSDMSRGEQRDNIFTWDLRGLLERNIERKRGKRGEGGKERRKGRKILARKRGIT